MNTTDKKNQHYVPKFYLRNFSFQENKKQIGVFNIFNKIYVQRAKLKTQASKNFYYGSDGQVEDSLADIEGDLAEIIRNIILNRTLPIKNSYEHFDLLYFISLTDLRNPVSIEGMKNMLSEMKKRILELDPSANAKKLIPSLSHEQHVYLSLSNIVEIVNNITDLDFKILINKTSVPFITSDFPVVRYNQFLEQQKWSYSKGGYGLIGLQIFIPLNSKLLILLFDSSIYKVGNRRDKTVDLTKQNEIDQLNILQYINCLETIYFNDEAQENYIRNLFEKSQKYQRANTTKSELSYLIDENKKQHELKKQNFMIINKSDCQINLELDCLKIHSGGKSHKLNPTMSQLRKHPENLIRKEEKLNNYLKEFYIAKSRSK